jgi:hypothetical protein
MDESTPDKMWIITREATITRTPAGSRGGGDRGGIQFDFEENRQEIIETDRQQVDVAKLKREMKGFLQAMRETLDEADPPGSKIRLEEVGD